MAQLLSPGYSIGDTVYCYFDSYAAAGESAAITGLAVTDIEIYRNGSVTQRASDNGYALLDTDGIDLDGRVGLNGFSVDTADNSDAGFFADGDHYLIHVDAVTIDSKTVRFSFELLPGRLLRSTVPGRKLDVTTTGGAGIDLSNVENPTTSLNLSGTTIATSQVVASVSGAVGSVTGAVGSVASGGITAASFATGAITRTTLAANTGLQASSTGTAQAGAAGSITLATGAVATDDYYNDTGVYITGGTGVGQSRRITDYTGTSRIALVSPNWIVTPDATSTYAVLPPPIAEMLSQANVRTAVGLASANLDTQLSGIQSDTNDLQTRTPAALTGAGNVPVDVLRIAGSDTAAQNLRDSANVIYVGTVDSSTTTTIVDDGLTQSGTDHWKGRIIIGLTGSLKYQASDILSFAPASDQLTYTAMTAAFAPGDLYVVL